MGQGSFIHVLNKPFGGFTVKNLMDKHVLRLGLGSDYSLFSLFCKVQHWCHDSLQSSNRLCKCSGVLHRVLA